MFLKVMERIISNALVPFATSANIIPISQHGFLLGRSTVENLFLSLNYQTSNLNFNIPMDIVYIDFSKAFDPAPRRNLLLKLEHYGITGLLLNWITAYLTGRTFSVRVETTFSTQLNVFSGVPQGPILGPIHLQLRFF